MFINYLRNHPIMSGVGILLIVVVLGSLIYEASSNNSNTGSNTTTVDGYNGSNYAGPDDSGTLPYENYLFTISAPKNNTITITALDGYRNAAIEQLYSMGVDPTNYKIEFNYESPFTPYE